MGARTEYQVRDFLNSIPSASSAGAETEGRSRSKVIVEPLKDKVEIVEEQNQNQTEDESNA